MAAESFSGAARSFGQLLRVLEQREQARARRVDLQPAEQHPHGQLDQLGVGQLVRAADPGREQVVAGLGPLARELTGQVVP